MAEILFMELTSAPWWSSAASQWGLTLAIFPAASVLFFLIARRVLRTPPREEVRLEDIRSESAAGDISDEGIFGRLTPALAAQLPEPQKERRQFELMLRQAGLYRPNAADTFNALRFVLLAVPLLAAGVWCIFADSSQTVPVLVIGAVAAALLTIVPRLYVYLRRRRRMRRIREGLPDTIDMLGMCVSGGLALGESLEQVARRLTNYPECAEELMLLKRQAELGNLKRALADFANRVALPETNQLAALLLRGSHLGTELVGSLSIQADHLRVARRQAATARANKMPVKLIFPVMFCFAPAAIILLTAPAVVQLRDFLTGRVFVEALNQDMPSQTSAGVPMEGQFGRRSILDALSALDQSVSTPGSGTSGEGEP
jgi:tight adherence protein C